METAQKAVGNFASEDDVLSDDFSSSVILRPSQGVDLSVVANRLLQSKLLRTIHISDPTHKSGRLPSGPYFIQGRSIHQAWKLYEDELDAFVIPTIPCDGFEP